MTYTVTPTHPHQAGITHILKSHPPVKRFSFSPAFLPYKQATDPISGIKSIDIMALNITMVTRPLYFVWMSYRGTHMLTGSLPEDGHSKSFNTARLGNNWKPLIVLLSLETSLAIKKIFRKMWNFFYCTMKNDYNRSSFVSTITSFYQKNSKGTLNK